ncbi:hypothetical protein LE181_25125 [Streptomyces sp. SCA3-4]|uniref:hypothetical protein n=1 Tax=Streptomyces sichuanensis TaxID=2871810 RepID=UPI001CE25E92|nr:hypothetical protein [Streptomyces sichuanensis]MCA6095437.1 hypothetical protein [Streptomyces sichuanensis]
MATPPQQPFPAQQPPSAQQPFPAAQQPVPGQQPFQQQPGFPPQGQPQFQQGFQGHQAHTFCRLCGGFPAVEATVRGHQGILIMMRFLSLKGPFCRNCGTSVWRDMTGKTLLQGWWSPLSLVILTPLTLLWNVFVRAKLNKLPPPVPGQPGMQLDPGLPLRKRPAVWGALIPVAWVLFMVFQIARGS